MKNVFYICFAVSAAASVIKIIIAAACRERVSKVFQLIIDTILLLVLISSFLGISLPEVTVYENAERIDFEKIEGDVYESVIKTAEELLSERVADAVEEKFSVRPYDCVVKIDGESMALENMDIYFNPEAILISAYDIKAFLKEEYNIKAEVIFK